MAERASNRSVTTRTRKKQKRAIIVHGGLRDKRQAKFLKMLSEGQAVQYICEQMNLGRHTVYGWRERYPEFRKAWDEALEVSTEMLEREAFRRAHDGCDEPVFHQGQVCGYITKYSDTLLIFLLKSRKPERYRDNHNVTVDLTARAVASIDLSKLTDAEIEEWERLQQKAIGSGEIGGGNDDPSAL
jgi:hypothetical protein